MTEPVLRFSNHLPVKIQFGNGVAARLPDVLAAESAKRVFFITDSGLEEANPPVAHCVRETETTGVRFVRHLKEAGEPTLDVAEAAAAALAESGSEAIVAIGGGSVMDTA